MIARRKFSIKLFGDGADIEEMTRISREGVVKGFTTNPLLLRKAGVCDYKTHALKLLSEIKELPISFEVFSDEFDTMEREAKEIAGWGKNVYVKIPIMNSRGESSLPLIRKLSSEGLVINVTAVMTLKQVGEIAAVLSPFVKSIVSIFAGRIADTGRDPVPIMRRAVAILKINPKAELLWASPRELLNIFQAESSGCHIITLGADLLRKLPLIGKDLHEFSLDTVRMFYENAQLVLKGLS